MVAPADETENGGAWYDPLVRIPADAKRLLDTFVAAQQARLGAGTLSGVLDWLTMGVVSGFAQGLGDRWENMMQSPSLYHTANWLTLGFAGEVRGAVAPEEPLSLEHWLHSLAVISALSGLYHHIKMQRVYSANTEKLRNIARTAEAPTSTATVTREFTITEELKTHIEEVDLSVPRKRGIGGAHKRDIFMQNNILIVSEEPHPYIAGITRIEYQMPKRDATGVPIPGEYQTGIPKIKTVYNTEIISTAEYLARGIQAANHAASQNLNGQLSREWVGIDHQGIQWRGYCENGQILSMFPEE